MQAFLNIFLMFIHFDKESVGQSKGFIDIEQAILCKEENSFGDTACKSLFRRQNKGRRKSDSRVCFRFSVDLAVERNALGACVGLGRSLNSVRLRRGIASSRSAGGTSAPASSVIAAL